MASGMYTTTTHSPSPFLTGARRASSAFMPSVTKRTEPCLTLWKSRSNTRMSPQLDHGSNMPKSWPLEISLVWEKLAVCPAVPWVRKIATDCGNVAIVSIQPIHV